MNANKAALLEHFVVRPYTIKEAVDDFLASMIGITSPNTVVWYKRRLPSLIKYLETNGIKNVDQVTLKDLRAWRTCLANRTIRYENHPYRNNVVMGGYSPDTLHTFVRACRRFFHWLEQEGKIQNNPAERLELPPLPSRIRRGIRPADRDAILNVIKNNPRDYALVLLLADTAARVSGISRLILSELDLDNRKAIVHEKGKGGYGKARFVFFTKRTAAALRAWFDIRPDIPGCEYVFIANTKRYGWTRLHEGGIYMVLKRAARTAGITRGFNPHNFRHGAIRGLLQGGVSLPEASQIAGHASVRVTGDIYGTFDDVELQKRFDECSWMHDTF